MQQYRDGQRLQGSDGNIYVVRNGVPVREGGAGPSIGNDPKLPGQLQGQQFSNQTAGVNARVNTATENAQIREANAKASRAESEASVSRVAATNPGAELEEKLRKEFEGRDEVKTYRDAVSALGVMLKTPDTGGGDIQVIYNFIRSQGPGPVAQGELDLAQSVASFRESLEQKYGKITESNRLPKRVRNELIEASRQAVAAKRASYDQTYLHYRDLAGQNGANAERVVGPHAAEAIRPLEEQYIRDHGGNPRSALGSVNALRNAGGGSGITPAGKGATVSYKPDQDANAFTDAAVRGGMSPGQFIDEYQRRFGNIDRPIGDVVNEFEAARKHFQENPNFKGSYGNATRGERLNPLEQAWNDALQTPEYTAAASYANAATAGAPSVLAGDEGRMQFDIMRKRDPNAALAGDIGGAVTGTLGVNRALGAGARALQGNRAGQFLLNNPGKQMALADSLYGGTFGATQNPDNPLAGAAIGAGAGLAGNAVGRSIIAPGARLAGDTIARTPIGQAALGKLNINPAPALPSGQSLLMGQAEKPGLDEVISRLRGAQDLNMPFTLADADPRLRALSGSVVRKSPDALALGVENIGSRTLGQADRAIDLIDNNLAQSVDVPSFKAGAKKQAQVSSRDLYKQAESHPSPDDPELDEMLRTPAGEQAARNAYARALNNGEKPGDLSFEVDTITGQPRVTGMPNWRTLHYVKMELDQIPEADSLRRRFVGRLGKLNKDYRRANAVYASEISKGDVVQSGYDAFNPRISQEQLDVSMQANAGGLPLFRQGFASAMSDAVDKTRLRADPYEVVYGSPRQQAKVGQLFPNAPKFAQAHGTESEMALTNKELFGGSPTQSRAEADKLFEGGFGDAALDFTLNAASGTPPISAARSLLFAGRGGFGGLRDAWRLGVGNRAKEKADQIAPILLNPDTQATITTLEELMRQKAARDAYVSRTGMFGSSIGAPLAITYGVNR